MTIVNVEHTSRVYRQDSVAVKALDDVSVTIGAGEFTTLVGPSGSGKTTLLNQIGALDEPSSGRIQIDGQEITGLSRRKRTVLRLWKIGFVFQEYNLIGVLSCSRPRRTWNTCSCCAVCRFANAVSKPEPFSPK